MSTRTASARPLAALCALALALSTATACGDDDSDSVANDRAATTAAPDRTTDTTTTGIGDADDRPASDEGQIRELITTVQRAFVAGDGQTVCDRLAAPGHRDLAEYGRALELPGDCTDIIAGIAKRNRDAKIDQPPVTVAAVRVDGPRATATIKVGGQSLTQRYVKDDGEWKVLTFGIGAATRTQNAP